MQRCAGGLRGCRWRRADHRWLYRNLRRLVVHLYGDGTVLLCVLHLVLYSFVSIVGATMDLGLLWNIADTFNGLMSIPNLIALLLLSGTVAKLVKEFFAGEGAR